MSDNLQCSFCLSEEDDRKYLGSDHNDACICSKCAMMFAQYMLNQNNEESEDGSVSEKNEQFQEHLAALEDKWMEKNVINSYILDAGGTLNFVTFRFQEEGDDFYFVCELEVEGIDELPDDAEENILNEIEWAFDDIREELADEGLDLDHYLGEKLLLNRAD